MANENKPQNRLEKLTEKLLSGPRNTPEETAQFKAEREALLGTAREWAEMQRDCSINRDIIQWLPNGSKTHGASVSIPGNADYEELCKSHKLEKPGDASTIFKRLVGDVWVVEDNLE